MQVWKLGCPSQTMASSSVLQVIEPLSADTQLPHPRSEDSRVVSILCAIVRIKCADAPKALSTVPGLAIAIINTLDSLNKPLFCRASDRW